MQVPAPPQLPAQVPCEEPGHCGWVHRLGLGFGEVVGPGQAVQLRLDLLHRPCSVQTDALHHRVDRRPSLGRGEPQRGLGKLRAVERGRLPRSLVPEKKPAGLLRVLVRHLGGRHLRRGGGGRLIGIAPAQLREELLRRKSGMPRRLAGTTAGGPPLRHPAAMVGNAPGWPQGCRRQGKLLPADGRPQFAPLRPGQRSEQEPLTHTGAPRQHPGVGGVGDTLRQVPQVSPPIGQGVGQDQLLLGPGHGHIEQAHLLRQQFLLQGQRHPGPGQGGKLHHSLPVQSLGPQAQPRVKENRLLQIPIVDPPSQAAEKDHRVLQPFGAVDGEDFHPGLLLGRGRHRRQAPALPYPVQMKEKAEEPFVSRSLKPSGQFIEGE